MAECEWAILCDYAFLDVGRKMCMIGVFDRVFAAAVPSALHQSSIAIKLLGEPNQMFKFRIQIIRPTGGQLASIEGSVQVGDMGAAELQLNIAGLALPDFGPYAFNVYEEDRLLKVTTFVVVQPTTAAAAGAGP